MLINYFKYSLRSIRRSKLYAAINIVGLAIGLSLCLLIFRYAFSELGYDRFHENSDDLYRMVVMLRTENGDWNHLSLSPIPLAPALQASLPEIVNVTRLSNASTVVHAGEKSFYENLLFADSDFLSMFSFELIAGDRQSALKDKHSVVLSRAAAHKYFGSNNPLGKNVSVGRGENRIEYTVSGIIADIPVNSTIQFSFLLPYEAYIDKLDERMKNGWLALTTRTYLQLSPGTNLSTLESKIRDVVAGQLGPQANDRIADVELHLQPLAQVHLNPDYSNSYEQPINPQNIYILLGIGVFILILACINVTNLSLGRLSERLREIGIRKVMGAGKKTILAQLLVESLILTGFSLLIALGMSEALGPLFDNLAGSSPVRSGIGVWPMILFAAGLLIFVSLASALYPALRLLKFNPVEIMRGTAHGCRAGLLVKSLIIFQFVMAVFFIIAAAGMSRQLNFMIGHELGISDKGVVVIPAKGSNGRQLLDLFKSRLGSHEDFAGFTGVRESLGRMDTYGLIDTKAGEVEGLSYVFRVDENFMDLMGLELLEGRNFSDQSAADARSAAIVNQSFVRNFGLHDPIGKKIEACFGAFDKNEGQIIGVVKDFNYLSLHTEIEPALLHVSSKHSIARVMAKLNSTDISGALRTLESVWKEAVPDLPFEYYFLEDDFNRQYLAERRWSRILEYSAILMIVIASLGLFGITALALRSRVREIGIRKVLGASLPGLINLIAGEFVLMLIVASLIAWPAAFYFLSHWIRNFAYRTEITFWIFPGSSLLVIVVAMVTIFYNVIRTALENPVNALRHE